MHTRRMADDIDIEALGQELQPTMDALNTAEREGRNLGEVCAELGLRPWSEIRDEKLQELRRTS